MILFDFEGPSLQFVQENSSSSSVPLKQASHIKGSYIDPGSQLLHENVPDCDEPMEGHFLAGHFLQYFAVVATFMVSPLLGSFLQSSLKLKFSKP